MITLQSEEVTTGKLTNFLLTFHTISEVIPRPVNDIQCKVERKQDIANRVVEENFRFQSCCNGRPL